MKLQNGIEVIYTDQGINVSQYGVLVFEVSWHEVLSRSPSFKNRIPRPRVLLREENGVIQPYMIDGEFERKDRDVLLYTGKQIIEALAAEAAKK